MREMPLANVSDGFDPGGQGFNDPLESLRIEDLDRFGERPQRRPTAAKLTLDLLQKTGLLERTERANGGIEEVEQDERAILIIKQAAIARLIALAADSTELLEQRPELLEIL